MRTVVVVPTYNEADNIAQLLERIFEVLPDTQVLVVDDTSPDGTASIAAALRGRHPKLDVWTRANRSGLGSAYIETFERLAKTSDADVVCTIDADFSHDPATLPVLLDAMSDHDMVVGSRYVAGGRIDGWNRWRKMLSSAGNRYARWVAGVPIEDLTSGFVCFRRTLLAGLPLATINSSGYAYTIESKCLAYRAGARIKEVPITFIERRVGRSKFHSGIVREGVLAPLRIRAARRKVG